jgi:hypothetical protein
VVCRDGAKLAGAERVSGSRIRTGPLTALPSTADRAQELLSRETGLSDHLTGRFGSKIWQRRLYALNAERSVQLRRLRPAHSSLSFFCGAFWSCPDLSILYGDLQRGIKPVARADRTT